MILDDIVANKKLELAKQKFVVPLGVLEKI